MSRHVTEHHGLPLGQPRLEGAALRRRGHTARGADPADRRARWTRGSLAVAVVAGLVALSGCSSTPAYCSDRTNLQNSVKGLTSLTVSSGLSGLKSQLKKIQSDAAALASSAKSDFPSQTSAITSSVNALKSAVQDLPSSPSAAQIAPVAHDAAAVQSSVKSFSNATQSKCS
jgi:hypothetical protein